MDPDDAAPVARAADRLRAEATVVMTTHDPANYPGVSPHQPSAAGHFPVRIDAALVPDEHLVPDVASVLQLPPRLLLHARLLDATDDSKVASRPRT
ncbi:hypothetical protein [Streptomyces sp. B1I3]|uniref:hypothetical protein n=1 Tax=Streptomyces sp. B1I3 TaxID=3042264 RepID=UPI0027882852|nr:hypothetical protein [Streptomyces sp. B1I3]MDQ0791765.1 hypothetical protein [Streptomyces sp. B1I3]